VRLKNLPAGAVDARAVVDEVARLALAAPDKNPAGLAFLLGCYLLARRELARRRKPVRTQPQDTVPLEEPRVLLEDAEAAAG
jgi:hypothetical protein